MTYFHTRNFSKFWIQAEWKGLSGSKKWKDWSNKKLTQKSIDWHKEDGNDEPTKGKCRFKVTKIMNAFFKVMFMPTTKMVTFMAVTNWLRKNLSASTVSKKLALLKSLTTTNRTFYYFPLNKNTSCFSAS